MNYTNNHHLPQWEKSDRIMMEDFNQAMSDIEAGIDGAIRHGDDAAAKASAAQTAANQAYRPGYLPYTAGTYTGNGGTLTLNLGFKPSFVIITGQGTKALGDTSVSDIAVIGPGNNMSSMVTLTNTGMTIQDQYSTSNPRLNRPGLGYGYIAFR